jgi:hypothetical protein
MWTGRRCASTAPLMPRKLSRPKQLQSRRAQLLQCASFASVTLRHVPVAGLAAHRFDLGSSSSALGSTLRHPLLPAVVADVQVVDAGRVAAVRHSHLLAEAHRSNQRYGRTARTCSWHGFDDRRHEIQGEDGSRIVTCHGASASPIDDYECSIRAPSRRTIYCPTRRITSWLTSEDRGGLRTVDCPSACPLRR